MRRFVLALLLLATPVDALEISDFGGRPDGSDTSPALAAALTVAVGGSDRTVHFGAGDYAFLTTPPILDHGIQLSGEGPYNTLLTRHYSNGEFFVGHGNGLGIRRLAISSVAGTVGGIGLHLIASDAIGRGGKHVIEDVRILAGTAEGPLGTFAIPLFLDGAQRLTEPIGIRAVSLRNVLIWNATLYSAEWWNCIACEWFGGGAWQGSGTTQKIIVGGPYSQLNWINANIDWAASSIVGLRAR